MNIAFIPVRGGSKSIPLKNIKIINGMPLIYWTLRAADNAACIDKVIVATDSNEIKSVVNSYNFIKAEVYDRDPQNARDNSSTEDVMLEYINKANLNDSDNFFLIQATSPMLTSNNIESMYENYIKTGCDSMFSAVREKQFHWIETENGVQPINYDYKNRPRRQNFNGILAENGACYINTAGNIKQDKCRLSGIIAVHELPSYTAYEIDEPQDWIIVENLMKEFMPD